MQAIERIDENVVSKATVRANEAFRAEAQFVRYYTNKLEDALSLGDVKTALLIESDHTVAVDFGDVTVEKTEREYSGFISGKSKPLDQALKSLS
ncbi:hypothetical protein [Persicirhabdus sediminis]|uniref:Uncharacterized protein n=1 Tax=Persicirhabdus sediminis TaxID=454144 RepID=A0A8J7SJW2_9BACT|nr:hypothetical protein [Persicirhabdus sediminis]MBK1791366.1 hypothetical protein [Persicirhabdus sediminis]